jgi:hypothetical protein
MKNTPFSKNYTAAAEVIGAIILVLIALGAFAVIYTQIMPVKTPSPQPHILLKGYIADNRSVMIEHVGGAPLISYKIRTEHKDRTPTLSYYENQPKTIGQYLPLHDYLSEYETEIRVTVWSVESDGSEQLVFDGIITPKDHLPGPSVPPVPDPMLISTLRTDTIDEDLICYNYPIHPNILPLTFIYNWMMASTGPYHSLTRVLMPFDTQNLFHTKDYSGNNYNGTVTGAIWTNTGKLGGAYQFNNHEFITIPYCFEGNKIGNLTVEAWIKTNLSSGTVLSYARNNYWELTISNGRVKWSTNSSDGITDVSGTIQVNDNLWHLIAVTYNSLTGDCAIYIDGSLDVFQHAHAAGKQLGSGITQDGAIGRGTGIASRQTILSTGFEKQSERDQWSENGSGGSQQATWTTLRYDDFNGGWGNYTSGGSDCYRTNTYKHEGTYAACIRDNSGTLSAFTLTNGINVDAPAYKSLKIDFWWMWNGNGWSSGEDWWVRYFNGTTWSTVVSFIYPGSYSKNIWYHKIVYINESNNNFPSNMYIRFQCDASFDDDLVYIDQLYINATSYGRIECDFALLPFTALTPYSGAYSLGGSGDFDPEYAAFNRTAVDISGYSDVQISFWYSYKNTESNDFFGLYYENNSKWVPIIQVTNPQMVGGQLPWTQVQFDIPKSITTLKLQFKWRTTATNEYIAIDDMEIMGIPHGGENNFTGVIDEVRIYSRVLSSEQLYQNYLCTKDGNSTRSVLVSEEIHLDESWKCLVTPNDGAQDDVVTESNILTIINYGGGG